MRNDLIKKQAFLGLSELHNVLDRIFDKNLIAESTDDYSTVKWTPKVDIKENKNEMIVSADIPGMGSKDIELTIENNTLTIKGKKIQELKEDDKSYLCFERRTGTFVRTIHLMNIADINKVTAKIKNGVLEIRIPTVAKSISRRIIIREE